MEIRLKGGPCDNAVFVTGERDITSIVMEVAFFSGDPAFERYHYLVETRETDDVGRRIFKYEPREVRPRGFIPAR